MSLQKLREVRRTVHLLRQFVPTFHCAHLPYGFDRLSATVCCDLPICVRRLYLVELFVLTMRLVSWPVIYEWSQQVGSFTYLLRVDYVVEARLLALIVYEYVTTIRREVELFWTGNRKATIGSILFFVNRYLPLLVNLMYLKNPVPVKVSALVVQLGQYSWL